MKFFHYLLFIVFVNYHYINAKRFDCFTNNPWKKDNDLLEHLNGTVTWVIKFLGFEDPENYNKMFGHIVKTISKDKLFETSYYMEDSKENTLFMMITTADIHDDYFAIHSKPMKSALVKYIGTKIQKPHKSIEIAEAHKDVWGMALIYYEKKLDIYVYQSCNNKDVAVVEVGDTTMRKLASGDKDFKTLLDGKINDALVKANINSRNEYTEFNELLDIFP